MSDCFGDVHKEIKDLERELRFAKGRLVRLEAFNANNKPLGRDEEYRAQEDLVRAKLKVQVLEAGIVGLNERLLRGWGGE